MSDQPVPICEKCVSDPYKMNYKVTIVKGKVFDKRSFPTCIICGKRADHMGIVRSVTGGKSYIATIH